MPVETPLNMTAAGSTPGGVTEGYVLKLPTVWKSPLAIDTVPGVWRLSHNVYAPALKAVT